MILDDSNNIMMFRTWQFWMLKWWVVLTLFQCEVSSCSTEHLFAAKIWKEQEGENQNERGIWPEGKEIQFVNEPATSKERPTHRPFLSHDRSLARRWSWWKLRRFDMMMNIEHIYTIYLFQSSIYMMMSTYQRPMFATCSKTLFSTERNPTWLSWWWLNYHQRRVQAIRPASSREPKYFHPVGVSKHSRPRASATLAKTN